MQHLQKVFAAILILSLTSCATIFSKKTYQLSIKSTTPAKVKVYDSIYNLPAKVTVKRSKEDLSIVLINDSLQKNYILKSAVRPGFVFGNLAFVHFAPLGWAVDLTNQKRFHYSNSVRLDFNDTLTELNPPIGRVYVGFMRRFKRNFPTNKGQINATFSAPWINGFNFKPDGETRRNGGGFMGLSAGLEYYLSERKFISMNASTVVDFVTPVPAPVDHFGAYEKFSAYTISLSQNHKLYRFTLGYGLSFSKNTWELVNNDDGSPYTEIDLDEREPVKKTNYNLGLVGNGYFRFKHFAIGFNYKPSLYNLNPSSKFQYEHVFSVDLQFRVRLKK